MFKRIALVIATLFLGLLPTPTFAATSSANSFYFKDFTADYYLSRDANGMSRMQVVETLTAVFPSSNQNHGITRVIPFTNNAGKNLTMASDSNLKISVERNGIKEKIDSIESYDGYFIVYIGDKDSYVHGEQVYTLTYEFENLILDEEYDGDAWQELYWDANGNDWSQRFDSVTANVHLAEEIIDGFDGGVACYVGKYGSTNVDDCDITVIDDGISFSAQKLSAREGLTFALSFEPGTFASPRASYDYKLAAVLVVELLLGVGVIICTIAAVRSVQQKRKFYKELFVKPEYTPDHGFTVAEMAENYIGKGRKGDTKVATLLELAVNHKIELIKAEEKSVFGRKKEVWKVKILSMDLSPEQVVVLKILAGSKAALTEGQEIEVTTHVPSSELTSLGESYSTKVEQDLIKKNLFEPKDAKTKSGKRFNFANPLIVLVVIIVLLCMLTIFLASEDAKPYKIVYGGEVAMPIAILVIGSILLVAAFAIGVPTGKFHKRTELGLEKSRYLEGLRLYIKMAEADRLKFLQSVKGADTTHEGVVRLYEKLLPYAAIFGLEKTWINELSRYYEFNDVTAPTWYVGMGVFAAQDFGRAMNAFSSSASTTIAHSSSSSSSSGGSGFSGGGFSGGGGGGGGGGGW